jgi:hypothetical protein
MSYHRYETYPKLDNENDLYYVEFSQLLSTSQYRWTLFKRQFIHSKEDWEKYKNEDLLMSNEGHPWNLGDGIVNENESCIDMNTKSFLKFMVDSLNKNTQDKKEKEISNEELYKYYKNICSTREVSFEEFRKNYFKK